MYRNIYGNRINLKMFVSMCWPFEIVIEFREIMAFIFYHCVIEASDWKHRSGKVRRDLLNSQVSNNKGQWSENLKAAGADVGESFTQLTANEMDNIIILSYPAQGLWVASWDTRRNPSKYITGRRPRASVPMIARHSKLDFPPLTVPAQSCN